MTRFERQKRLAEAYRIVAAELEHHFHNGSEFLHLETDRSDSPDDVVALRFDVFKRVAAEMRRRSQKLEVRP